MSPLNKNSDLAEDLAISLKSTTSLVQNLLSEIRDNATSLVILKERLESLSNNVEKLSKIVQNGNGGKSLITRFALLEQSFNNIENQIDDVKDFADKEVKIIKDDIESSRSREKEREKLERSFKQERIMTKLKIFAIITPGLVSLAILIVKMFTTGSPG